ncbi:ABC-three component system protein [Symbiobacterium terraclitae]|uniref:ABC-three component system protein n=1 Tax=Symbiobacterium terraclitae TaxID=557451 RepID=UPI0035B5455F
MPDSYGSIELSFHHMAYHLRVLESSGEAFQHLFVQIMERAYPGSFESVKPYGNQGDWKCDGRLGGQYFQCYAPAEMKVAVATAKIREDFAGCIARWGDRVKEWTLVHNSREGLPAPIWDLLDSLRSAYPNVEITCWHRNRLWEELKNLPYSTRCEVLGAVPGRSEVQQVTFAELEVIVKYLNNVKPSSSEIGTVVPPEEKMEKNKLGNYARQLITIGVSEFARVKSYIDRSPDPNVGEVLRQRFNEEYRRLKAEYPDEPDLVFGKLHRFASCWSDDTKIQGAGLTVLCYFFVTCDVFRTEEEAS